MDMQNAITPEMNQAAPNKKLGFFALVGVVLLTAIAGGVYYFGFSDVNPPSLPSQAGGQGYISHKGTGFTQYEKTDKDNYKKPTDATTVSKVKTVDSVAYLVADRAITLKDALEKYIVPQEGMAIALAKYDPTTKLFYTTEQTVQNWKTASSVVPTTQLIKGEAFIVITNATEFETYLAPPTKEVEGINILNLKKGWNMVSLKREDIKTLKAKYNVTSGWVLNSAGAFDKALDLSDVKDSELTNAVIWLKFNAAPAVLPPVQDDNPMSWPAPTSATATYDATGKQIKISWTAPASAILTGYRYEIYNEANVCQNTVTTGAAIKCGTLVAKDILSGTLPITQIATDLKFNIKVYAVYATVLATKDSDTAATATVTVPKIGAVTVVVDDVLKLTPKWGNEKVNIMLNAKGKTNAVDLSKFIGYRVKYDNKTTEVLVATKANVTPQGTNVTLIYNATKGYHEEIQITGLANGTTYTVEVEMLYSAGFVASPEGKDSVTGKPEGATTNIAPVVTMAAITGEVDYTKPLKISWTVVDAKKLQYKEAAKTTSTLSYTWKFTSPTGGWELTSAWGSKAGETGVGTTDDGTCFKQLFGEDGKALASGLDWGCEYMTLPATRMASGKEYTMEVTAFDGALYSTPAKVTFKTKVATSSGNPFDDSDRGDEIDRGDDTTRGDDSVRGDTVKNVAPVVTKFTNPVEGSTVSSDKNLMIYWDYSDEKQTQHTYDQYKESKVSFTWTLTDTTTSKVVWALTPEWGRTDAESKVTPTDGACFVILADSNHVVQKDRGYEWVCPLVTLQKSWLAPGKSYAFTVTAYDGQYSSAPKTVTFKTEAVAEVTSHDQILAAFKKGLVWEKLEVLQNGDHVTEPNLGDLCETYNNVTDWDCPVTGPGFVDQDLNTGDKTFIYKIHLTDEAKKMIGTNLPADNNFYFQFAYKPYWGANAGNTTTSSNINFEILQGPNFSLVDDTEPEVKNKNVSIYENGESILVKVKVPWPGLAIRSELGAPGGEKEKTWGKYDIDMNFYEMADAKEIVDGEASIFANGYATETIDRPKLKIVAKPNILVCQENYEFQVINEGGFLPYNAYKKVKFYVSGVTNVIGQLTPEKSLNDVFDEPLKVMVSGGKTDTECYDHGNGDFWLVRDTIEGDTTIFHSYYSTVKAYGSLFSPILDGLFDNIFNLFK
ncbi:hypothetical protein M0P48_00845 [Candidatus Gracilibacteria bacterium]|nr:hypothetical protein [Candidatus Gracilibacteria bacterium]